MRTIQPTKSPAVWTSMATGEPPSEHGITQFIGNRLIGGSATFSRIRSVRGIGLRPILSEILRLGAPLHGGHRREAAYWEMASAYHQPVIMVNWWMSWPATPMDGWMVTERIHARSFGSLRAPDRATRVTFPPSLRERVNNLRLSPEGVSYEDARRFMDVSPSEFKLMQSASWKKHRLKSEFKYMYSMFETNRRISKTLLKKSRTHFKRPADLLLTFRLLDIAGHTALRYSELTPSHPSVKREAERKYERVVTQAYREVDRAVGQLLENHEDGYVFVVSDHGFDYNPGANDSTRLFDHDRAPEGVWMLSGPGIREGERGPLSIYEVLPALAYLKDFALSLDWKRTLPRRLFEASFLGDHPPRTRSAYDSDYVRDPTVDRSHWDDRVFKKRLEALGYLE